jgi:hypothetical protein
VSFRFDLLINCSGAAVRSLLFAKECIELVTGQVRY